MDILCYIGLSSQPTTKIETYISEKQTCVLKEMICLYFYYGKLEKRLKKLST